MQSSFMDILLTGVAAKAVCWTLVHSLWQGLLAALVAGAVILTTRRSAAVLRYNLLVADLVLFLAVAAGTFSYELKQGAVAGGAETGGKVVVVDAMRMGGAGMVMHVRYGSVAPAMLYRINGILNRHAGIVALFWMACLSVQLLRMTGGLYRIHRLRRQRVFLPSELWKERMSVLMARLGIEKKVVLLQSGSVKMPVTFGFLKPSILVPLGMLANLPADQVETILLHELAHIRRSDYLANLLLYFVEAIFFFNPGIRWVGWLIREEREACCDDLVLAGTRDRNSYFEALIAFGGYALGRTPMALQLGSGRGDLLWRIRRMLNQENKELHLMEKTILSFGLMAVLAIGLVSMKGAGRPGAILDSARPVVIRVSGGAVLDTVPAARAKKSLKAPVAPVVTEVVVTTAVATPVAAAGDPVAAVGDPMVAVSDPATPVTTVIIAKGVPVAPVTTIAVPKAAAIEPMTTMKTAMTAAIAPATNVETPVAGVVDPVTGITGPTAVSEAPVPAPPAPPAPPVVENDLIKGIIKDLEAKGMIQGVEPLSFRLDKHGMEVNGVKVSDEVFSFFKDKYITNPRNRFSYSHEGGTTTSTVWVY